LAFKNLELERVGFTTSTASPACRRVLQKNGFHPASPLRDPDQSVYEITRQEWQARRDGAALAALHPLLSAILEEELSAGNEVVETGSDWPDDPHWWKADYSAGSPRHVLAC
jgi:hypothetical protein